MNQITSISVVIRRCLIACFFLFSVFTSENAFSNIHWHTNYGTAYYCNIQRKSIFISFPFYTSYLNKDKKNVDNFLWWCDLEHSEDGVNFAHLVSFRTEIQDCRFKRWIIMSNKKDGEQFKYRSGIRVHDFINWPKGKDYRVEMDAEENPMTKIGRADMLLKWKMSRNCKNTKYIRIKGGWRLADGLTEEKVDKVIPLNPEKSNSNILQNAPSVLKSEISDNVLVTGETDAISVKGAEPGENIKIYTVSGVEVKSVVANDDVVNIKLPTNQIYIVKAGQARYKVAL